METQLIIVAELGKGEYKVWDGTRRTKALIRVVAIGILNWYLA